MKLTIKLSFLILLTATTESFAQSTVQEMQRALERINDSTPSLEERVEKTKQLTRELHLETLNSIERNRENFDIWVVNFYARELKVATDRKTEEIGNLVAEKDKQEFESEEQRKIILNKEFDKLEARAAVDLESELREWFRRDFPNTPWGQFPRQR